MKKYKIEKTVAFINEINKLSKKEQKEVNQKLDEISKNPTKCKGSMSLFGPPSVEEIKQWADELTVEQIDLVFEYLRDKNCLNKNGKKLAKEFWEKEIQEDQTIKRKTK